MCMKLLEKCKVNPGVSVGLLKKTSSSYVGNSTVAPGCFTKLSLDLEIVMVTKALKRNTIKIA